MDFIILPATFCLLLGLTSGEYMGNFDSQGNLINDGLNQASRRLLYVVGVYPEWAKKIADFKSKWGEYGEKYLNQEGVYIHGDIRDEVSPDEVSPNEVSPDELSPDVGSPDEVPPDEVSPGDIDTRRIEEAMLRPFFQEPFIPHNRRNNSTQKDAKKDLKFLNSLRRQYITPGIVTINVTQPKRKTEKPEGEVARRRALEYQKFAMNILDPEEIVRKKNLKIRKGVLRKSNNLENENLQPEVKENTAQRKYSNIQQMYHQTWFKRSEPPNKEAPKNNDDINRKYSNIDRMYGRVVSRKFDDEDIPEDPKTTTENYSHWMKSSNNRGLLGERKYKKFRTKVDKQPHGKLYARPVDSLIGSTDSLMANSRIHQSPEEELKWIKQVLLPKLINSRRTEGLKAIPESSAESFNWNMDEIKEKRDLNLKAVESGEDFLKKRSLNRRHEAEKFKTKLDEDAEDAADTNI